MASVLVSKVKHEQYHKPHHVKQGGLKAYDFEYSCVKYGKKFSVGGVIKTDSLEHAKRRTNYIYKNLRTTISSNKHVAAKKLEKAVRKCLHHTSDLKSVRIAILKR